MARRRPASARRARPIDARSLAEALSYPGIDGRTWISYATVDGDPIDRDDELGFLVPVTLQPSQVQAVAVVGQALAGDGEGEYFPFVEGDTCLVAIPHGMERSGVVIFARLNNARAPAPKIAAGQDVTKGGVGYRRLRAPFVQEYGDRWTVRSATSEALIGFEASGAITLRDGGKGALQMSSSAFGYQDGSATCVLQFDLVQKRLTLQAGEALLVLGSNSSVPKASTLNVPGTLSIGTGGNPAVEHVATTEAVYAILASVFAQLAIQLTPIAAPLTGPALAALFAPPVFSTATLAPSTLLVTPQNPVLAAALFGAFAKMGQKPPGVPGQGQLTPGIGCKATFAG